MSIHADGGRETAVLAIGEAQKRAAALEFLSGLYRKTPNAQVLAAMKAPPLCDALAATGVSQQALFGKLDDSNLEDDVAAEFASLFLLPGGLISPHESVQSRGGSGILRGRETAQVRDFYEQLGFEIDEASPLEPDHISVELEFLGHLALEEALAREDGDEQRALQAVRFQREFLRRHLGHWAPGFLERIEAHEASRFYRPLGELTKAFLADLEVSLSESAEEPAT